MRLRVAVGMSVSASLLAAGGLLHALAAQEPAMRDTARPQQLDSLVVTGRYEDLIGVARTASEGSTGWVDLRMRPLAREGELLETVPGLILTQHSGDGKSNQMFVRGFNLDHGTDFNTRVDGMPINLPTHAHGQGYTDVNFIIPEFVERVDYQLGVYYANLGDFSSAGGAEFRLSSRLARPIAKAGAGEFGHLRAVAGGSVSVGSGSLLLGGEVRTYNGPWVQPQELRKLSGLARYSWDAGRSRFAITGMAYANTWDASDQIPTRAVEGGLIGRFGQVDSTLGGEAQRYSLDGQWRRVGGSSVQEVQLYGIWSDFNLYSNFTYFLADPVNGDQFNQRERRAIAGLNARHFQGVRAFGVDHEVTLGLQSRADFVRGVGLFNTQRRDRVGTVREDDVTQWGTGLYAQAESRWSRTLRSSVGLRGDAYLFDVDAGIPANGGTASDAIVSPKASVIFSPGPSAEFYLSGGFGFHSNDARGTTITVDPVTGDPVDPVDPLVRSRGAEVGARVNPTRSWRSTLTLWALSLDSELLFVGDGGTTEPSFPSRRAGVTSTSRSPARASPTCPRARTASRARSRTWWRAA
ncbi:MAG: TonB-dependent receptor plug domain-containing protein [Gemmatimonadales bacterium]|nr:TonB-dependent receptor plug domain-containing protein [Gemmatimonadales bacterium]